MFSSEVADRFKIKELNTSEPEYGAIQSSNFNYHGHFELKQIEKEENTLGNKVRPVYDLSTFAYEDEEELRNALKLWFKEFIGGERITPGRDYRSVDNVPPTLVVIENNYVVILTMSCFATDQEEFRQWRSDMLGIFGSPEAMIVELGCDGPLEWTKNAPDPRDPSWRR